METIITIILSLLIVGGAFSIGVNVEKKTLRLLVSKSKNTLDMVHLISKDLSDDPSITVIVHSVFEGIEYAVGHYATEDKDGLILAGVCYTEEILCRMGVEIDNHREELVYDIFIIAYDLLCYEKK